MKPMKKIISFALILCLFISSTTVVQAKNKYVKNKDVRFEKVFDLTNAGEDEPNPDMRMAHNIYSDPDLSNTSGKFNGFMIDFKADYAPIKTYWALCNFWMDLSELSKNNTILESGGAYCGLQNTPYGKKAIMSFWNIKYKTKAGKEKIITPSLVYPVKNGNEHFDGEGEGAKYLADYEWDAGKWYKMYICSYNNKKSGTTYVDMSWR